MVARNFTLASLCALVGRQRDVGGFRAQRVGFAVEFLRQEIELAADRRRRNASSARASCTCACQPVELFAHIGLRREQRHFLRQTVFGDGASRRADPSTAPSAVRATPPAARRRACPLRPSDSRCRAICPCSTWPSLAPSVRARLGAARRTRRRGFRGWPHRARRAAAASSADRFVLHDHALERQNPVDARGRQAGFGCDLPWRCARRRRARRHRCAGRARSPAARASASPGYCRAGNARRPACARPARCCRSPAACAGADRARGR